MPGTVHLMSWMDNQHAGQPQPDRSGFLDMWVIVRLLVNDIQRLDDRHDQRLCEPFGRR